MDAITKWRLNEKLTFDEGCKVLNELYGGARKHFVFGSKVRIDKKFLEVYENFNDGDDPACVLKFSNIVTQKPFVTPTIQHSEDQPTSIIPMEDITLYLYE